MSTAPAPISAPISAPIPAQSPGLRGFVRSLSGRDRRMLFILLGLTLVLFILLALVTPSEDANTNPVPSSYLTGQHGAKAAYTLLEQSGYAIERWHSPLSDLAAQAGPSTVLILAEPFPPEFDDEHAVREILRKGGRVLATGSEGSLLLPLGRATRSQLPSLAACEAAPQGLSSLAAPGSVWINTHFYWKTDGPGSDPDTRVDYACGDQPVVVDYPVPAAIPDPGHPEAATGAAPGHAIWWASATPLENGSIQRGANLDLLLNSLGPPEGKRFYWDESLHGERHTAWEFVHGPVWTMLLCGFLGLLLLVVLSFSRRSGPLRALPQPPRTTPIEFLDALGSLYRSTGAASTALQIAFERFRSQAALFTGQRTAQMNAAQISEALERRFGSAAGGIAEDLAAAEEASWDETIKPRRALALVRALRTHEERLRAASRHAGITRAAAGTTENPPHGKPV
jgi:hypothetical protein